MLPEPLLPEARFKVAFDGSEETWTKILSCVDGHVYVGSDMCQAR